MFKRGRSRAGFEGGHLIPFIAFHVRSFLTQLFAIGKVAVWEGMAPTRSAPDV